MSEWNAAGDTVVINTAAGPMELTTGIGDPALNVALDSAPYSVLIDDFNRGSDAQAVAATSEDVTKLDIRPTGTQLIAVQTPTGIAYLAPGAPDWVNQAVLDQLATGDAFYIDSAGPGSGTVPPAPVVPQNPPTIGDRVASGLTGAASAVAGIGGRVLDAARGVVQTVYNDVTGVAGNILNVVKGTIDSLLPTIEELAVGLTSRFADLAAFVGAKVVDVETYAATVAAHGASALSAVLDDAWKWIYDALAALMRLLSMPLETLYAEIVGERLGPVL